MSDEPEAETAANDAETTEPETAAGANDEADEEDIDAEIEAEALETEAVDGENDAVDDEFMDEFENMDDGGDVDEGDLEDFEKEMEDME